MVQTYGMDGPTEPRWARNAAEYKDKHASISNKRPTPARKHQPLWPLPPAGSHLSKMAILTLCLVSLLSLARISLSRPQQSPLRPEPVADDASGTAFLDHDALIAGFSGKTWLKDNIPFIDIPDQNIQDVYYYRWTSTQRNLRYVIAGTGFMSTEFVQPVGYAQAYGTIVAAAGHQLDESKWLRSPSYAEDYINIYNRGPANSTQYTEWISYVANQRALVTGDDEFLVGQLDDMIRAFREWDKVFDSNAGLYYYQPVWDAQELSLPGFIADPDNQDWDLRKDGPDTYRPSHNSYMVANARAIARAAGLAGQADVEAEFTGVADNLAEAMTKRLWASEQSFFMDIIRPGNPDLTPLTGRQQVGLWPYRFDIGLTQKLAQPAVDAMFDPEGFLTEFGPTTLEVRDPWYMDDKPPEYCCYWNGQSWPYSTGHTISALAAIYRSGTTNVTADQFHQYMTMYSNTLHKNGVPYVAESHFPHENAWSADGFNHSEHYAHSTYVNNVIGDLFGILPQPNNTLDIRPIVPDGWKYFAIENVAYHGHLVTVLYDADGSRYGQGKGLTVFVNGKNVYNAPDKAASLAMPAPARPSDNMLVNIAANPEGGTGHYPLAEATYTYSADWSYKAVDGVLYYDDIPDNRWTNFQSPNTNDTLTITFARPHRLSSVVLALYSDAARGGAVDMPSAIEITGSGGAVLANVTDTSRFLANDRNEVIFAEHGGDAGEIETTFLAINLFNRNHGMYVGLCEVEVWQPWTAPEYYAVDAYLTNGAIVAFGPAANASSSSSGVVRGLNAESRVSFSGVVRPSAASTGTLRYANSGGTAVAADLLVNQQLAGSVRMAPTGGAYRTVDVLPLLRPLLGPGKNFVTVVGGTGAVSLDMLVVK